METTENCQCTKQNCMNIQCRIKIPNIGYICGECKIAFRHYLTNQGIGLWEIENSIIEENLQTFMNIPKLESYQLSPSNFNTYFENLS